MYIYQRFKQPMFNNVLSDVAKIKMQKTLTLDELHIYGSSRHGINKPKKRVVAKSYVLETIETDGTFDYGAARDSTFAKTSKTTFKRTVTYKQYELTNHLGNVLATVLDRKILITNSGDTFYSADVSTAGMYYAFGSSITDLSFVKDTGKYRYGFNGEEKEADISGEGMAYDLGARFYDGRLGRMFSANPLEANYSFWSPYAYCGNSPICIADLNGMGPDDGTKTEKVGKGQGVCQVAQGNEKTMDQIAILNKDKGYFSGYYSGKDSNGKTYWAQRDGNGNHLWHWNETDDVIVPVKQSKEICGPQRPVPQKSEATILDERMHEIYNQASKMGCPNAGNPACSTYYEQISVLRDQYKFASLDVANGQILPKINGPLDRLWNFERTVCFPSIVECKFDLYSDYIVNADGYIIRRELHSLVGYPPGFEIAGGKSLNQLNQMVNRGQAPSGILRFDKGKGTLNLPYDEVCF